jgi:hypothetical protein
MRNKAKVIIVGVVGLAIAGDGLFCCLISEYRNIVFIS